MRLILGAEMCNLPGTIHGLFEDPGSSLAFYMTRKFNRLLREEMIKNPKNIKLRQAAIGRIDAMILLAKPVNIPAASSHLLKMCDDLWYHAGDRSIDAKNALNMSSSIAYSAYKTAVNIMGIDALRR
uniref:COQ9 domain-containing protein n=1 Tax=Romanomermis culicivorax TaxID=13658 RepID=A0A915HXT3_ROMCU